jgi:hypothetical protein
MKFFAATALAAIVSATSVEKGTMQMRAASFETDVVSMVQGKGKFRSPPL